MPDADPDDARRCTELCTLDGVTYVATPDGVQLPEQPPEILDSIQRVEIGDALKNRIKAESTHTQLIAERVLQKIRARYTPEDEAYFARIGVGSLMGVYQMESGESSRLLEYGRYVEECRTWGRVERAKLGL